MLDTAPETVSGKFVLVAGRKPTVLFYAAGVAHTGVREWLPSAEMLKTKGYDSVFIVDEHCPERWTEKCLHSGARCRIGLREVAQAGEARKGIPAPVQSVGIARRVLRILYRRLGFVRWLETWVHLKQHCTFAAELLARERPVAIMLYTDSFSLQASALVKAANEAHIPTVVCPLAGGFPKGSVALRRDAPDFVNVFSLKPLRNRVMARLFPNWVVDFYGERMLYRPVRESLVATMLGILPRRPWSRVGGNATYVTVMSDKERHVLLEEDVPTHKLVVTGRPLFDALQQHLLEGLRCRTRILRELGADANKTIILISMPWRSHHPASRTWGYQMWPWDVQWREYEFLLEACARLPDVEVVLSFHPGAPAKEFSPLAEKHGARIAWQQEIVELVASCDIFVAEASATLQLAIGARKPALLLYYYDEYDRSFRSARYDHAVTSVYSDSGVLVVWKREELSSLLQRLVSDKTFYERLAQAQERAARHWVTLDGNCTARLVHQLLSAIENGTNGTMERSSHQTS